MKYDKTVTPASDLNPFLKTFELQTKAKRKDPSRVENKGKTIEISEIDYVDRESFVKVFVNCIGAIINLSAAAHKLFLFIIASEVVVGEDEILLDPQSIVKRSTFSRSTFERGRKDLIKAGVISKHKGTSHRFWCNPRYFFCGDRVRLVKEYALKAGEKPLLNKPKVNAKMEAMQKTLKHHYAALEKEFDKVTDASRGYERVHNAARAVAEVRT